MLLLGIQPFGTMMEIELDMLVDYSKPKNIKSEIIHKLVNTIGKKLTLAMNANKSIIKIITTREVGKLFSTEKYTMPNGGLPQIPQSLTQFGSLPLILAHQLQL